MSNLHIPNMGHVFSSGALIFAGLGWTNPQAVWTLPLAYLVAYLTAGLLTEPFTTRAAADEAAAAGGQRRNRKLLSDGSLTAPAVMVVNHLIRHHYCHCTGSEDVFQGAKQILLLILLVSVTWYYPKLLGHLQASSLYGQLLIDGVLKWEPTYY